MVTGPSVFEWPDTALARTLRQEDAEARERLSAVRMRRYATYAGKPTMTLEERREANRERQRLKNAARRAAGEFFCCACRKWVTDHSTSLDCPNRSTRTR